ncbi:MAG: ribosomal RNA small subunit methyltransferase A [Chloroflexi bacterium]|nr:ribosomal RNA small subunit methyltransferase A [Chloroflexota bacterium]
MTVPTASLFRERGVAPRKALGQHLLVSEGVLEAVVAAAELQGTETVIEVGPGTGLLTRRLARAARRVVAVELDPAMVRLLREELHDLSNLTLIEGDILVQRPSALAGDEPYLVVANLPYYIATPTVRLFLEAGHRPQRMVVMVQREVAQEMAAPPGALSLLSLAVQVYAAPCTLRRVRPGSFRPVPKVESAILRLDVYPEPRVPPAEIARFYAVARAGFSAPRKQLRNALAQGTRIEAARAAAWLERAGLDPRRRPETLSLDEWLRLARTAPEGPAP